MVYESTVEYDLKTETNNVIGNLDEVAHTKCRHPVHKIAITHNNSLIDCH